MIRHSGSFPALTAADSNTTEETNPRGIKPFMPPAVSRPEPSTDRPRSKSVPISSAVHFVVHPGMPELRAYAEARGWFSRGFHELSVPWVELAYTTDGWKTVRAVRSTDVPCPVVNGYFFLPHVPANSTVEFALHVGLSCHAPNDAAGEREHGDVWLNNGGQNYQQVSR